MGETKTSPSAKLNFAADDVFQMSNFHIFKEFFKPWVSLEANQNF